MSLEKLIGFADSNAFVSWPNYDKEAFVKMQAIRIKEDSKTEKVFEYYNNSELACYFHVKYQEWDSMHFGFKCAQIKYFYLNELLPNEKMAEIIKKVKKDLFHFFDLEEYKFVFADINSTLYYSNFFVQMLGFNFVVNWIDGFHKTGSLDNNFPFNNGLIKADEVEIVSDISKHFYYKGGRFYTDKNFYTEQVDEMYYSIVKNSFKNNDVIVVARNNDKPVGAFISKPVIAYDSFKSLKVAHLRFLVLDENYRGNKLGQNLFSSVLNFFNEKCDIIVTGLESHNHISMNLHNKFGFKYNYSHNAYHLWIK